MSRARRPVRGPWLGVRSSPDRATRRGSRSLTVMRTNTEARAFDVVEITNEMPLNRIGGVGTVIEHLMTGFARIGVNALWFVVDHPYSPTEVDALLRRYPST